MTYQSESSAAGALIAAGMAAFADGDNERARHVLSQAVRLAPGDERGWLGLGMALAEAERRIYCLERCLQINPGNVQAQQVLAALRGSAASAPLALQPSAMPTPQPSAALTTTPLAARLAAAAARKGGEAAPPLGTTPPLPPAIDERGEIRRAPRISAVPAPPALQPISLSQPSETADGRASAGRLSDEEIADAALRQLLRREESDEADARRTSAANIAQRYFGRSASEGGQSERTAPTEALRALGMEPRKQGRGRVAALLLVVIGLVIAGALLLGTLLRAQEALRLAPDAPYARRAAIVIAVVAPNRHPQHP